MKYLITKDVYNISSRIKQINPHYNIVYDMPANKYMVYCDDQGIVAENVGGRKLYYVMTIPYNELDFRTLKYVYSTRIDNLENIIAEIDKSNQELQQNNRLKIKNQALEVAENKLRQLTK